MLEQKILILPSEETLRKLTKHVGVTSDDSDGYLKLRFSKLEEDAKDCTMLIDEVYVAKRVEFSAPEGQITGLTPGHSAAGTVLCFMVNSVRGKYKDVVGFYPVNALNAEKLNEAFLDVMKRLCLIGFRIFVVITDNLSVNRRFFQQFLGGGQLKTCVQNPVNGEPLFLVFDPTHNFKNIYNNFQRKKTFSFPRIPGTQTTSASFG